MLEHQIMLLGKAKCFTSVALRHLIGHFIVRPFVRQKFLKFLFLRVLELAIFGNFGNCSIPNFPKSTTNDVKLELQKLRKTHSDLKTDSKVRLKVWNAGPYLIENWT